jgi:hypothetical protein
LDWENEDLGEEQKCLFVGEVEFIVLRRAQNWQADKRDRLVQLREQVAVQNLLETELNKTIHITGMSRLQSVLFLKNTCKCFFFFNWSFFRFFKTKNLQTVFGFWE